MTRPATDADRLEEIMRLAGVLTLSVSGSGAPGLCNMVASGPDGEVHVVRFQPARWPIALEMMLRSLRSGQKRKAGRASSKARRRPKQS